MQFVQTQENNIHLSQAQVLSDFRIACESRQASLLGRKEVFAGKAKFGIFGDGKELAQLAMARFFTLGDFRSGYYRDQTFMLAAGVLSLQEYFAQLYAHTDIKAEPASGGRMMNGHFGTRMLDEKGNFKNLTELKNSTSDISPTGSQMPRLLGLAYASKLYRENPALKDMTSFSRNGNEIAFGTIGNASTSEGMFFEVLNAAGVLKVPMLVSVWDDEYGISVPKEYHTIKGSISDALAGFQKQDGGSGFEIIKVKGWDYHALLQAYQKGTQICRETHTPVLIHVQEMTQPQGHSTSGSHERYKSAERLNWEQEFDCIKKFREWIQSNNFAEAWQLDQIEQEAIEAAKQARANAWNAFIASIEPLKQGLSSLLAAAKLAHPQIEGLAPLEAEISGLRIPQILDCHKAAKKALRLLAGQESMEKYAIAGWLDEQKTEAAQKFNSHIHSQSNWAISKIKPETIQPLEPEQWVDGREIIKACFDAAFERDPRIFAIGEDVGKIGDVNQGLAGMQEKYGILRVTDTGIRECSIIGQGIGAAMRGLRPITEIQYLDYLAYAIQILSDDVASMQYRTAGGQKAPLIVRTRGHRLEGIWHSGSPISMILGSLRGMVVCVPRNFVQAAGMYNTLFEADEPALVIECLNGYRLKEKLPANIGSYKVELGVPEVIREGTDITIVTYGSMCRVVLEAAQMLAEIGIEIEVIDVQTLLPFDKYGIIGQSVKKTGLLLFADEDVPGGAAAYMMQQVLEHQNIWSRLDASPKTISAQPHRPAYGSDGDYFSKPNPDDIFDAVYAFMTEQDPASYPPLA